MLNIILSRHSCLATVLWYYKATTFKLYGKHHCLLFNSYMQNLSWVYVDEPRLFTTIQLKLTFTRDEGSALQPSLMEEILMGLSHT